MGGAKVVRSGKGVKVMLTATNLKKSFDGKTEVLKGVNLTVEKGEFISILGASGSGKSTLLTILGGMDRPTDGEVTLDGVKISDLKERDLAVLRRTKVGFVFQFFNLAPYLSVGENINLPLILDGKNVKNYAEKFDFLTKYLRIENIINKMPAELSGGEQQRTAIARALIYEPEIVFLDEPTGNLDSESSEEIMQLLKNINSELGATVLQVTHSEHNARYGTRLIRIKDGLITEDALLMPVESEERTENGEEAEIPHGENTDKESAVLGEENADADKEEKENLEK